MSQQISTNTFGCAKWIVSANPTQGTHTTIASAIASASSGDTILIRDGNYTEDLTLKIGVTLTAFLGDAQEPTVTIIGKCSATGIGTYIISNINLQTNSDYCISVTGSSATTLILNNCNLNGVNNTAINHTSSSANSAIQLNYCNGSISSTYSIYSMTSPGFLGFYSCSIGGSSSSPSSNSNGVVTVLLSNFSLPFSTTSTGTINFASCTLSLTNLTSLTLAGTGSSNIFLSNFSSGTASAISIGTGTTVYLSNTSIKSSNTNAITGLGTLYIGNVTFVGSSSTINTTTVNAFIEQHGTINLETALSVPNGGTGLTTLTTHALYVGNGTSSPNALAIGTTGQVLTGNTGADPSWQSPATSGTVTSVSVVSANGFAGSVATATSTPAITLTTTQTGLLSGNATAITGTAITQYNILSGGATNAPNSIAPSATSGVPLISQGASSQPVFGTAVVAGGGTGATTLTGVLTGNGTSAVTASAVTQYAVLVGGASNAVGSIADVATGQVLVSGGTSANPAFSAYPQVSGFGIGASPGSTAGLTFDGTNFMSAYSTGTWTPTLSFGGSTTGITYSAQSGMYTKIGKFVMACCNVTLSSKGAQTGIASIGGLPFSSENNQQSAHIFPVGGISFPTLCTYLCGYTANSTNIALYGLGSSTITQLLDSNFNNSSNFIINFAYIAAT